MSMFFALPDTSILHVIALQYGCTRVCMLIKTAKNTTASYTINAGTGIIFFCLEW